MYLCNFVGFITGLLHNIGTHVDPILLIRRIEEGMQIPGLRDSLVKILQDFQLQVLLHCFFTSMLLYFDEKFILYLRQILSP